MNSRKLKTALLLPALVCSLVALGAANVRAALSTKQARKAITRMVGFELKDSSVRVKSITATSRATTSEAEVSAEIRTVFKLAQDKQGRWRVAEIRTGQDTWEDVELIANALRTQVTSGACTAPDLAARSSQGTDPSTKRARCLLGSLLGVEIPSDEIRIQEVAPMPIPLASQASATVVAWVKVEARLLNDRGGWRVTELRTGNREWVKLETLLAAVNQEKQRLARTELESIARALECFRKDRGFYIVSDSHAVAIDHLSPRYLALIIRVDPWHHRYQYQGERDHFTLSSAGPDGKAGTPDDISINETSKRGL